MNKKQKPLVTTLIEDGLGYCCEFGFFSLYGRTALIAIRLGVTKRAVQYRRSAVVNGCSLCESKPNCLKKKGVLK